MFVYLRNLNSSTPPETCKRPISDDTTAVRGEIMQLSGGVLKSCLPTGDPKYLLLESKEAGDGKREICCIRLLHGMVISADLEEDAAVVPGTMYQFYFNNFDRCLTVMAGGNDLEALSTSKNYTGTFIVN